MSVKKKAVTSTRHFLLQIWEVQYNIKGNTPYYHTTSTVEAFSNKNRCAVILIKIWQIWVQFPHHCSGETFINSESEQFSFIFFQYKINWVKNNSPKGGFREKDISKFKNMESKMRSSRQGLRARESPILGDAFMAFESYSAENVTSDLGLHSRWHSIATFPLSENRVFTTVKGSTA